MKDEPCAADTTALHSLFTCLRVLVLTAKNFCTFLNRLEELKSTSHQKVIYQAEEGIEIREMVKWEMEMKIHSFSISASIAATFSELISSR